MSPARTLGERRRLEALTMAACRLSERFMDDIEAATHAASPRRDRTRGTLICGAPGSGKSTILGLVAQAEVAAGRRVAWVRPAWDDNVAYGADTVQIETIEELDALDLTGYDMVLLDHMELILGVATVEQAHNLSYRWRARVIVANERIPQRRFGALFED